MLFRSTATGPGDLAEFNKFGFTVIGASNRVSGSTSYNYIYWAWKAGGANTVTNTSGSITSQVSANPSAGFSIVTYTGTSAAGTIGHGLSAAPNFIILRRRTSAADPIVYHSSIGNTVALFLDGTNAAATSAFYWNNKIGRAHV